VPSFRLAEDGLARVIDRFDLRMDGTCRGFEDFCVLNARRTDEKYRGSYENSVMKRFAQFANSPNVAEDMEKLFTLIALNCALRNGDAHLKNFGIVSDDVRRPGGTRTACTPARVRQILERIGTSLQETTTEVRSYMTEQPEFAVIGAKLLQEWAGGATTSLRD
jgi:serine/threonine-protein kinase HipA